MLKKSNWKNFIIISIIILLLVGGILSLFLPRTYKVNLSSSFLEWQNNNPNHSNARSVTITGIYKKYIIGQDNFTGTLKIEGITDKWETTQIFLPFEIMYGDNIAPIFLYFDNSGTYHTTDGWLLACDSNFQNLSIFLPPSLELYANSLPLSDERTIWSPDNTLVLSYPAQNREQAVTLTQELCKDTSLISEWK